MIAQAIEPVYPPPGEVREIRVAYARRGIPVKRGQRILVAKDVHAAFKDIAYETVEVFRAVYLDGFNQVIAFEDVSRGIVNRTMVHPREVFWSAIYLRAVSVIVMHNHPSGTSAPSPEDVEVTRRLKEAGETLGIKVLDHVIVTEDSYYSFKEHNRL